VLRVEQLLAERPLACSARVGVGWVVLVWAGGIAGLGWGEGETLKLLQSAARNESLSNPKSGPPPPTPHSPPPPPDHPRTQL